MSMSARVRSCTCAAGPLVSISPPAGADFLDCHASWSRRGRDPERWRSEAACVLLCLGEIQGVSSDGLHYDIFSVTSGMRLGLSRVVLRKKTICSCRLSSLFEVVSI